MARAVIPAPMRTGHGDRALARSAIGGAGLATGGGSSADTKVGGAAGEGGRPPDSMVGPAGVALASVETTGDGAADGASSKSGIAAGARRDRLF